MNGTRHEFPAPSPVVIIGGGIVGIATAYYLSIARESGSSITIVDNASILFAGASGKANGILGDSRFKPEAESLGKLSWELHQQLASEHGGWAAWAYRDVIIYNRVHAASNDAKLRLGSTQSDSPLPPWCRNLENYAGTAFSDQEYGLRINPADFCKFLRQCCGAMGVRFILDATIADIRVENGSPESVTITQNNEKRMLECHSLVIAAGPWSERVLSGLFPNARVRIPSSKQPDSGNYIILRAPGWDANQDTNVCHQIYLETPPGGMVDISSRPDGTLYIGGSLSAQEALPETTNDVQYQPQHVHEMKKLVAMGLDCSSDGLEILELGRAYRPCLEQGRPIITQVPFDELLGITHQDNIEGGEVGRGGVYLNVGHGWDGITLGPGSGKVMSELIDGGISLSADISGLGIS